jgi:hypothetical protein
MVNKEDSTLLNQQGSNRIGLILLDMFIQMGVFLSGRV